MRFLLAVLVLLLVAFPCRAATIHVPADYPKIQQAIDAAHDGDLILVSPGTYTENITFRGKTIILRSTSGPAVTTINGGASQSKPVVEFLTERPDTVLDGFTITNSQYSGIACSYQSAPTITNNVVTANSSYNPYRGGGGIYCDGAATITGNVISSNSATLDSIGGHGGGIYFKGTAGIIRNNVISNNSAAYGGGLAAKGSALLVIEGNTITGNSAPRSFGYAGGFGGGIYCEPSSSPIISNNTISENTSYEQGNGIYCDQFSTPTIADNAVQNHLVAGIMCRGSGAEPLIEDNTFTGNSAAISLVSQSGASITGNTFDGNIYGVTASEASCEIHDNVFAGPTGPSGGAISISSGTCVVTGNMIFGFVQSNSALYIAGSASAIVTGNVFHDNHIAGYGGALYVSQSDAQITENEFTNNSAGGLGGAIYLDYYYGNTVEVTSNIFTGNIASQLGGAICDYHGATIRNNRFEGNQSSGGGAIYELGSARIESNLLLSNTSGYFGGGAISCEFASNATIVDNIIAGNSTSWSGGGTLCYLAGDVTLTNNTIVNNSAGYEGGGLSSFFSNAVIMTNTIAWGNIAATGPQLFDYNGTVSVRYSDVEGGWVGDGNINADPLFRNPASDFHLQPGSPCINAGDNLAPSLPDTDFEGDPRILYGVVDIGADEFFRFGVLRSLRW